MPFRRQARTADSRRANGRSRCCLTSPNCSSVSRCDACTATLLLDGSSLGFAADTQLRPSRQESSTTWPPNTTGVVAPSESSLTSRRRSNECGTPGCSVQIAKEHANPACVCADSSVVPGRSQLLRRGRGRDRRSTTHPRRSTTRQLSVTVSIEYALMTSPP
ncbi:hypothetical protein EVAR_102299_1 [Eumeta japonica]|uniref:Uncharacterized protein n=1 Tax=Eumeta variegata TaxID=151549 RepID=A0A4C1WHJ1_EUMVA|nr:hypothetical protein EVAR_102299_1 [Eumeta japonica]